MILYKELIAQCVSYTIGNKTIFEMVSRTYSLLTRHTSQINFTDRIKITCAEQEHFSRRGQNVIRVLKGGGV